MSEKKTKKRDGKAININPDIHKMLKIQSTITEKNMVELVENAILDNMPEEILAIFDMTKNSKVNKSIKTSIEKSINQPEHKSSMKSDSEINIDELDDDVSCYL